ncbi:MAG: hypothetical protein JWQ59_877 [Cryobacterium sp.]|jgi:hypothetical protein|nr:hypothetical protein [Cryobacterium sp.]
MSTIKHPVGPQSSTVYWRRRLVVGLGLLAVLVIIFLIIVRPGSSSGEPQPTKTPAATASADTASGSQAATVPGQAASVDGSACDPKSVTIEALTDAVEYKPGQQPQLSLSITNTGTKACVLDVGTSKQVFTISSGKDVYWTSTDCQTDAVDAQVSLEPGVPVSSSAPIAWDRTRSSPDTCDLQTRDAAPAGGASYHLTVTVDGIESGSPKQFLLY